MFFALWLIPVVVGIALYEGRPEPGTDLPLQWYDKILRYVGPLLPLVVAGLRVLTQMCPTQGPSNGKASRPSLLELGLVYISITVVRIIFYLVHLGLESSGILDEMPSWVQNDGQLLSDHILLGASMICILQIEAALYWPKRGALCGPRASAEGYSPLESEAPWKRPGLWVVSILGAVIFGLTIVDMFYTALYFHQRFQSTLSLALGTLAFQVPSAIWLRVRL